MRQFRRDIEQIGRQSRCAISAAILSEAVALGCGSAVFGQCQYELTAIISGPDCPFIGQAALIPTAMNEAGDVAGYWLECDVTANHAFYWSAKTGALTTLPRPPQVSSAVATGLNDNGLIIGTHSIIGVGDRAFVYDLNNPDAGFTYMQPKHGVGGSWANALNNDGVIGGARSISKAGNNPYNAVIWRPLEKGAPVEDLGVMGVGPNSTARGINQTNVTVVGWTGQSITSNVLGFSSTRSKSTVLGPIPGGVTSRCGSVDESGTVLGSGHIEGRLGTNIHAFLWRQEWLEILAPPLGFDHIGGGDLNNVGQRALTATVSGGQDRPFLWQNEKVINLTQLVAPGQQVTLNGARAINNHGQVLLRSGTKAVVLTPIDIPFGDLNYDCKVDGHDLQILLNQWGTIPRSASGTRGPNGVPSADLNGDGVVDGADLLILLSNWNP